MRETLGPESVDGYLDRLGVARPDGPSMEALRALFRAHVERVPYETLDIQIARPTSVDPEETVARVLRGRGGYCVQLNSAFATLLSALGYAVAWHRAGVQTSAKLPPPGAEIAPHLAPVAELDGERWLVDVGLGDGLIEPIPLRPGAYRHGHFTFRLGPSEVEEGGWRFDHDPRGSIAGMDVAPRPAGLDDFVRWHPYLAESPESRLVRTVVVMRRDGSSSDTLTGCLLRRVDAEGRTVREVTGRAEWFAALADVFGLTLDDLDAAERDDLWTRVHAAHLAWLEAKARKASA